MPSPLPSWSPPLSVRTSSGTPNRTSASANARHTPDENPHVECGPPGECPGGREPAAVGGVLVIEIRHGPLLIVW